LPPELVAGGEDWRDLCRGEAQKIGLMQGVGPLAVFSKKQTLTARTNQTQDAFLLS